MAIPVPSIDWPTELHEFGPSEDPGIVLIGVARISGVRFDIVALRMQEGMRTPDFLSDLPEHLYDVAICEMLDEIECLSGSVHPGRLRIRGAEYILWMVPTSLE